jgi:hypothetical protein
MGRTHEASMRRLLLLLLPLLVIVLPGCPAEEAPASVYPIETADQRVGGPSALAIEGDWILENGEVRVGLLSERCVENPGLPDICSSPGPGLFGGSLIDIDLQRNDSRYGSGRGQDQFAEMFSAMNLDVTAVQTVEVLADGSDGGPAILRSQGPPGDYISFIGLLGGILGLADGWYITDYIVKPGDPYVTVRSHMILMDWREGDPSPPDPCGWVQGDAGLPCDQFLVDPPMDERIPTVDALNAGATQFGDFFFAGGNTDIFLPGIGFQEDHAVVETMEAGVNPFVNPFGLPYIAATGDGVSYAMGTGGWLAAPIFTSSLTAVYGAAFWPELDEDGDPIQPPDGTVFTYERYLAVGEGDVGSAVDNLYTAFADNGRPVELGTLTGHVLEMGSLDALSGVQILVYVNDPDSERDALGLPPKEDLFTHFTSDVGRDDVPDGSFGGRVPGGEYLLVVKDPTRGLGTPREVTVPDGGVVQTGLYAARSAILEVEVIDDWSRPLPCKVSLRPVDEGTDISLPDLGDPYIGGGYSKVFLLPAGTGRMDLPAGRYDVLITRGLEYTLYDSASSGWPDGVVLNPGQVSRIDAVLGREVDSTGFISADLHVHATASHDSGIPLETRVISMVSEGVEFLAGTDHDVITDYRPVIESLGLDMWLQATPGLETTTMELGHYLAFPLQIDYQAENGGALDWTGLQPFQLIQELQELGAWGPTETAVIVAHPRDGILGYFDQYGLSHFEGSLLTPELDPSFLNIGNELLAEDNFTLDFDGFELLNGKRMELIRTPTQAEMDCHRSFLDGEPLPGCESGVDIYDIIARTMEEQTALEDFSQDFFITRELEGTVDDWFNLLNLGYRHTGIGNSDTHGLTSTEAGCPRNYVVSDVDSPELIDERDVAAAVREGRVVTSYGPLIRFTADGHGIGSDVDAPSGTVTLNIEVQAPRWMLVDRVELYENGRLIAEFDGDLVDSDGVIKLDREIPVAPTTQDGLPQDAWYVVTAMGRDPLAPVFTPVDIPHLQLNDIVVGALSEIDLGALGDSVAAEGPPIPLSYPVLPFAITNPIWVNVDGTERFDPLGEIPIWFRPAPEDE